MPCLSELGGSPEKPTPGTSIPSEAVLPANCRSPAPLRLAAYLLEAARLAVLLANPAWGNAGILLYRIS